MLIISCQESSHGVGRRTLLFLLRQSQLGLRRRKGGLVVRQGIWHDVHRLEVHSALATSRVYSSVKHVDVLLRYLSSTL